MKKVLISLSIIGAVAAIAIGATVAYFSDTETSTGNTFSAATLDLEAGGPGFSQPISVSGMKPGDDTGYFKWIIKNTGSIPGKISVTFSPITNDENDINEPEQGAENQSYATTTGELGQYLIPTVGWGPKGSSVPSNLYNIWQAGPPHPWGTPGLNGLGGNTYGTFGYLPGDILNPGQEVAFFFRVTLDKDLRRWDGTTWVDVDDNIIQSDSVRFDITFRLDQVTP